MRYPDGHYLIISAAGIVGEQANYPKWLRTYLIVLVSAVWTVMVLASLVFERIKVDPWVHGVMGVVVASLFSVEFGGIRLISKKDDAP